MGDSCGLGLGCVSLGSGCVSFFVSGSVSAAFLVGDGDAVRDDALDEAEPGAAPITAFSLMTHPSPTMIGPS